MAQQLESELPASTGAFTTLSVRNSTVGGTLGAIATTLNVLDAYYK